MARGEWDWSKTLKDHVIIVAPGRLGELFLVRLVVELDHHKATRGSNVVVVSDEFREGLSGALVAGDVKLVSGLANDPEALEHAGVARSAYVIVLASDPDASISDSLSFDIVSRVREVNQRCEVISQCVDDRNHAHLLAAGANVVMRPVRGYPEIIITSLLNPGSMEVLSNLFSGAGERIELVRGSFRGDVEYARERYARARCRIADRGAPRWGSGDYRAACAGNHRGGGTVCPHLIGKEWRVAGFGCRSFLRERHQSCRDQPLTRCRNHRYGSHWASVRPKKKTPRERRLFPRSGRDYRTRIVSPAGACALIGAPCGPALPRDGRCPCGTRCWRLDS